MSKEAKKGAAFESQIAGYMARRLHDGRIERRVKNGIHDRGDIAGVRIRGRRTVIECKCCKRMELAGWLQEAEAERGNDDAEYGIVIHKRKGCGEKSLGRSYATMELDTLLAIIAGGRENLDDER